MNKIVRIEITFPVGVSLSANVHRYLHDVLDEIAAEYECANLDRVMWAAGEGGRAPPGFMFDEPQGEWDMSVLCIEFAERERYESDKRARPSIASALRNAALEEAADAATAFLVGDPANGVPLRNPMPHEIAERILSLTRKPQP